MRSLALGLSLLALAAPLLGQQSDAPILAVQDTPPMRGGVQDTAAMRMRREWIEQRFGAMVQQELRLNDPQMQQLRAAMHAHLDRRTDLAQRQMAVNQAIRGQMQPGIAADRDSLSRLEDAQLQLRIERVQQEEQLRREVSFLDPVRRLRFMQMMRRFEDQVQEIVRRRQMMRFGAMGPGRMGPAARPLRPRQMPRP